MKNEQEKLQFEMVGSFGEKILCDVLFTFESKEWDAHYIVYAQTDHPERISASRYIPSQVANGTLSSLLPIETDEEWDFVERVINEAFGQNSGN